MHRVVSCLLFLALLVPASGHDAVPVTVSPLTVPRLEWQNGSICSAVVLGDRIITAHHCVGPKMFVVYGTQRVPVDGIACESPGNDFAVLRAAIPLGLPRVTTGDLPPDNSIVWIAGWPKGRWAVEAGRVNGVMLRVMLLDTTPPRRLPAIIVVTNKTLAYGGVSGGGMFDTMGRLVGLVCCKDEASSIVAAVPINYGLWHCPRGR